MIPREELRELEGRKRDLERQMQANQGRPVELHPNIANLYAKRVAQLQDLLSDEEMRDQAIEIIRSLIDKIEVRTGNDPKTPDVILSGALAQILSFAENGKENEKSGRVLMVAGAGFEPATFRL